LASVGKSGGPCIAKGFVDSITFGLESDSGELSVNLICCQLGQNRTVSNGQLAESPNTGQNIVSVALLFKQTAIFGHLFFVFESETLGVASSGVDPTIRKKGFLV